jgi:hypothetical protein
MNKLPSKTASKCKKDMFSFAKGYQAQQKGFTDSQIYLKFDFGGFNYLKF